MAFEFATAGRIVFGRGGVDGVGKIARELGTRALVVSGRSPARGDLVRERLAADGLPFESFVVGHEPDIALAQAGAAVARTGECDVVIGIGGGSVVDAAKAIAALAANDGDPLDYLEVVGRGQPLARAPFPCVAIPTTAGTGSEVTRNSVLTSREQRVKVSMRSPRMLPRVAIVDPELTLDLPPALTASTGLDALTQLIEPFVSVRANPMTDALCEDGIPRAARALPIAYHEGHDVEAREEMSLASLYGGLALANSGLGAVHGFAGPIGGMFDAPHGAVCAILLPRVIEANVQALESRAPENPVLARFSRVAALITGRVDATPVDVVTWLDALIDELHVPRLGEYRLTRNAIPALVDQAQRASSMKANPIVLTADELSAILDAAM